MKLFIVLLCVYCASASVSHVKIRYTDGNSDEVIEFDEGVDQNLELPKSAELPCLLCKDVVDYFVKRFKEFPKDQFQRELLGTCEFFGPLSQMCSATVKAHFEGLYDAVANTKGVDVCTQLKVC